MKKSFSTRRLSTLTQKTLLQRTSFKASKSRGRSLKNLNKIFKTFDRSSANNNRFLSKKTPSFTHRDPKIEAYFPKRTSRGNFNAYYTKQNFKKKSSVKEKIKNFDKVKSFKDSYENIRKRNYQNGKFRKPFSRISKNSFKERKKSSFRKENKIINQLDEQIKNIAKNIRNLKVSEQKFFFYKFFF